MVIQYVRDIAETSSYDIVVCGGGPAGTAAALSAKRNGLSVLLVEGQGQLGGMGTSGLVSHWLGGRLGDCRTWVVGGIFRELCQRAAQEGIALIPDAPAEGELTPHGWMAGLAHGIPFDPFAMVQLLDRVLAVARVEVLLLTHFVDVRAERDWITHLIVHNKSGLQAIPCRAVIDATGDADVAARSGCEVVLGRSEDGLMAPATLQFHIDRVDQDALADYIARQNAPRFRKLIAELRERGIWRFPYEIFISVQLNEKGVMMINTPRICGVDGTDGLSLSRGYVAGRQEIANLLKIMRAHFPGFREARIKAVPRPIANLICPGRAVSVERDVLGPLRVTAPCMAMGEAAGMAACQAVRKKIPFREVDTDRLRAALKEQGAIVDVPKRNGAKQGI